MGKTSFTPHVDPLVEGLINSDPDPVSICAELRKWHALWPRSKKVRAMLSLYEAGLGQVDVECLLPELEGAFQESCHPDRHIFFLLAWARVWLFFRVNIAQVDVLLSQARALVGPQTPPILGVWVTFFRAVAMHEIGNSRGSEDLMFNLLEQVPPRSPHFQSLARLIALETVQSGKGASLASELTELLSNSGEVYRRLLSASSLIGYSVAGRLDPAIQLIQSQPVGSAEGIGVTNNDVDTALQVLGLMAEFARRSHPFPMPDESSHWVASTQALLRRDGATALQRARLFVSQSDPEIFRAARFEHYCLIRAELAHGHIDAALRLLATRQQKGCRHFMDEFFEIRIQLLLGNRTQAAAQMHHLLQATRSYEANGRLDFEIALTPELTPSMLMDLGAAMAQHGAQVKHGVADRARTAPVVAPLGVPQLIHADPKMDDVVQLIQRFSQADVPCLITGETGTGKELVARALHEVGHRRDKPYIALNCAALNEALLESELFGHQRGAFTGAQVARKGLFLEAADGSLFLDEIGEISARLQVSLLRVLESGDMRPVGSNKSVQIQCRIIVATNANLEQLVADGRFRADLLYRLKRLQIALPPLRQRPADIDALSEHFLNCDRPAGQFARMDSMLKVWLKQQAWPGNVRELRNHIERMRILNSDKLHYTLDDATQATSTDAESAPARAPHDVATPAPSSDPNPEDARIKTYLGGLSSQLRRVQKLRELFVRHPEFKVQEVANILGISRVTAGRYLASLSDEGYVRKVMPNGSPQTHYYVRVEP